MSGNRKKAEEFFLKYIAEIEKGQENVELYKKYFSSLSDKQFDDLMSDIENNGAILPIVIPNYKNSKVSAKNNIKVGKRLGHEFFKHLRLTDPATGEVYVTPEKYMVIDLIFRAQNQTISKKMSVIKDTRKVDTLTDQPTGASKTSSLSFPEINVLSSLGLERTIEELIKDRGGDSKALNAMVKTLQSGNEVDLDQLRAVNGKVKSTETLSILLKGMHLQNNL